MVFFYLDWCQNFLSNLLDNTVWNVGNGENIRLWTYNWWGEQLVSLLQIPEGSLQVSNAKLSEFIVDNNIVLPTDIVLLYPMLLQIIADVYPNVLQKDMLMWKLTDIGHLYLKDAFIHVKVVSTVQAIWNAWNQARFQNVSIPWKSCCSSIVSMTLMAGNSCNFTASSSMTYFMIMENFSIKIHPPIPKCLKEILWCPPHPG
ncbi:hypothetical protein KIW84_074449 [Lathyrus oleraceus]|uniref:Uncharacterized protein n=1 Tax=Pisum sativum TaxID=3888 RepID=A0A9D4VTY4_PEA|nr:hypothetical protein KIW84_074449 [Pisum sativum]